MESKDIEVDYDFNEDIISLNKKDSKVKFSMNVELPQGDIVVDFGFDGKIVGLELFNASSYLPFLKANSHEKIEAKMNIQYGNNWAMIFYEISLDGKKMSSNIISPYNKELVIAN